MPENANLTFARNWLGRLPNHVDLSHVPASDREALAAADTQGPYGVLTMREARDYLIVNGGQVRTDADATAFRKALSRLFGVSDCLDPTLAAKPSRVCYVQLNNASNAVLREEKDIRAALKTDGDKPTLALMNLTSAFNGGTLAESTATFKAKMSEFFDSLIAKGERMGGFIISGHSNGTAMLEEYQPHMYRAKLYPRDVLLELRQTPKYAKLMDSCEKVGPLACFHGNTLGEWAQIFPNAIISGTTEFAPAASSPASGELYRLPTAAEELFEKVPKTTPGQALALLGKSNYKTDLKNRGATMWIPGNSIELAEKMLDTARTAFDAQISTIKSIRATPSNHVQSEKDRAYSVANSYYQTRQQVWILNGKPAGDEPAALAALAYLRDDLFAIRKGYPQRPVAAANVNVELAYV